MSYGEADHNFENDNQEPGEEDFDQHHINQENNMNMNDFFDDVKNENLDILEEPLHISWQKVFPLCQMPEIDKLSLRQLNNLFIFIDQFLENRKYNLRYNCIVRETPVLCFFIYSKNYAMWITNDLNFFDDEISMDEVEGGVNL
jgi:hypothetical protein